MMVYYSAEVPALVPFLRPTFALFVVLGPFSWIDPSIHSLASGEDGEPGNGLAPLGGFLTGRHVRFLRICIVAGQLILVVYAIATIFVAIFGVETPESQ